MSEKTSTTDSPNAHAARPASAWHLGQIEFSDRLQRLVMGLALISLNLFGLYRMPEEWTRWLALVLQVELIASGFVGWCPITFACRLRSKRTIS